MTSPLRILHVVPHLGLGGVTAVVQELLKVQERDAGLEVQLAVLESGGTRFPRFPAFTTAARIHGFGFRGRLGDVGNVLQVATQLRTLIRTWQPNIVHSHLWPAALITATAMWGLAIVHLDHVHDIRSWLSSPRLKNRLRRTLHRQLFARCPTHFVAVAEAVQRCLLTQLRLAADQVTVVLNGVDTEAYKPITRPPRAGRPLVIGTAGRFTTEKGHTTLIRAVAALQRRGVSVECRLAGSGSLQPAYEQMIREANLERQVLLCGERTDMAAFYREIDAFLLPSVEAEGLPITVLEAMATGLPVISTRVGGVEEVIRNGKDGLVVSPGSESELAAAIEKLSNHEDLASSLGSEARKRIVNHFTAAHMATQVRSLYDRLVLR